MIRLNKICDVLCDLVSFVQFEKREYTHGGVLLLESSTPPQVFFSFFKLYSAKPRLIWLKYKKSWTPAKFTLVACKTHGNFA